MTSHPSKQKTYLAIQQGDVMFLEGYLLLIVDKDTSRLRQIKKKMALYPFRTQAANSRASLLGYLSNEVPHIILVHYSIAHSQPEKLLREFLLESPQSIFYFYGEPQDTQEVVRCIQAGANGFLSFPFDIPNFVKEISMLLKQRVQSLAQMDPILVSLQKFILFRSEIMKKGLLALPKIATTPYPVLITGETGTGKELVAQAIHRLSSHANNPFIALNCGAIPENLIESELFGHEKGAFTGANAIKKGKFELAGKGTLFLDEIGEMPLHLQVRFLRALEDKHITRLGGEKTVQAAPRIVAATRSDLEKSVTDGIFREDLYYRLNVLRVHLPPLRERLEDIPFLAWHFLQRAFQEIKRDPPYPFLTESGSLWLQKQRWDGNVRELRNIMTRIAILLPSGIRKITAEHLMPFFHRIQRDKPSFSYQQSVFTRSKENESITPSKQKLIENAPILTNTEKRQDGVFITDGTKLKDAEEQLIERTLDLNGGNLSQAAESLGVSSRTLSRRKRSQKTHS